MSNENGDVSGCYVMLTQEWVVKFETGSGWEGARHCVEVMK